MVYYTLQGLYHDKVNEENDIEEQIKDIFSSFSTEKGLSIDLYKFKFSIRTRNCLSVKYEPLQLSTYLPPPEEPKEEPSETTIRIKIPVSTKNTNKPVKRIVEEVDEDFENEEEDDEDEYDEYEEKEYLKKSVKRGFDYEEEDDDEYEERDFPKKSVKRGYAYEDDDEEYGVQFKKRR